MKAEEKCQQDAIYPQRVPQIQNSHKCKTNFKSKLFSPLQFPWFYLKFKELDEQDELKVIWPLNTQISLSLCFCTGIF